MLANSVEKTEEWSHPLNGAASAALRRANMLGHGKQGKHARLGLAVEELLGELNETAARDASREMFIHKRSDQGAGGFDVTTRDGLKSNATKLLRVEQKKNKLRKADSAAAADS